MADNQNRGPLHRNLRALWLALCVIGNVYQVYTIGDAYLAYGVASQVQIGFPEIFQPPAATLCFTLISMVKLDKALKRWPDMRTTMSRVQPEMLMLNDTSLKEAIAKMSYTNKLHVGLSVFQDIEIQEVFSITYNAKDLFARCQTIRSSDYAFVAEPCENMYEITESIKGTAKCFTFKAKEMQSFKMVSLKQMIPFMRAQSSIVMKETVRNLTNDVTIYYHSPEKYSREGYGHSLLLTPLHMFTSSYLSIETQLLPLPFKSACRQYSLSGFQDRGHCFETCLNEHSLEVFGTLGPGPNFFLKQHENERMNYRMDLTNASLMRKWFEINEICGDSCWQPDCKEVVYIPLLLGTSDLQFPSLSTTEHVPRIRTTDIQALGLIDCITDLLSSLGFWIGATCLSVFDLFWNTYFSRGTRRVAALESPSDATAMIRHLQLESREGQTRGQFVVKMDDEAQSPLHWKLRTLWFALCIVGNAYQVYIIGTAYLAHDIASQVKIKFPETYEPPAISLCFALASIVKLDMAIDRAEDIFIACTVIRASDYAVTLGRCQDAYSITESFKSTAKCFTFKLKERQEYNYLNVQRLKQYPGGQNTILMPDYIRNMTSDMTVFYHPQETYTRDGFSRSLLLSPMEMFTMTYITIVTEKLPAPFENGCQNYSLSGFEDRGHCYESCLNKRSLEKLGQLSRGPNVFLEDSANERFPLALTPTNVTFYNATRMISNDCDQLCSRPNCKSVYHMPQLLSTSEFKYPTLATVEQFPKIKTTDFPKLNLIECISDLLSSLGFWIGATCLSVFDLFWSTYFSRATRRVQVGLESTYVQILAIRQLQQDVRSLREDRQRDRSLQNSR
ncbi:hypothetical protein HDE_07597 [Halotydeus destructor]|nr:hypothetical protein HDE_07597 [Halotydeus destructor]